MQRPVKIDDFEVPVWWDCVWQRVSCGSDRCRFCGRMNVQRRKHIERGGDPDSIEAVMEDVRENFADVRLMLTREAERRNIDLANFSEKEDVDTFNPMADQRSQQALAWRARVSEVTHRENGGDFWQMTEAAVDLFWYANTFVVKTARDVENIHALEQGDKIARVDYEYTRYVLVSVCSILDNALALLESSVENHSSSFAALCTDLTFMTQEIHTSQVISASFSNSRE